MHAKLERRGAGVDEHDPVRLVTLYFSPEGQLLAERDPWLLELQAQHRTVQAKIAELRADLNWRPL